MERRKEKICRGQKHTGSQHRTAPGHIRHTVFCRKVTLEGKVAALDGLAKGSAHSGAMQVSGIQSWVAQSRLGKKLAWLMAVVLLWLPSRLTRKDFKNTDVFLKEILI